MFPPGASVAMAKQSKHVLTALAVGNDGALYESWTAPGGWNKPTGAKGPGPYPPVGISKNLKEKLIINKSAAPFNCPGIWPQSTRLRYLKDLKGNKKKDLDYIFSLCSC
jgi:hypothetical protein